MADHAEQLALGPTDDAAKHQGPVECLGMTFESDTARRDYFLAILREKLKDPEFRAIEGFPIGEDEDILALSDPPYYTACPNPFIADFIRCYGKPYDPETDNYKREPFAADVSEGKNDSIYSAHPYHTKVPPKAILRYILNFTEPGDVVLDFTCGTGMTGVAASLSGKEDHIRSLNQEKSLRGTLANDIAQANIIGGRHAILCDLSPSATWISYGLNHLITPQNLSSAEGDLRNIAREINKKYIFQFSNDTRRALYIIWSDILRCPECSDSFTYWDVAVDQEYGNIRDSFHCPKCDLLISKSLSEIVTRASFDASKGEVSQTAIRDPVIAVLEKGKRSERFHLKSTQRNVFQDIESNIEIDIPRDRIDQDLDIWYERDYKKYGIYSIDKFFTNRNLESLSTLRNNSLKLSDINSKVGLWVLSAILRDCSLMTGMTIKKYFEGGGGPFAGGVIGTYFIPSLAVEKNVAFSLENRIDSLNKVAYKLVRSNLSKSIITTQSATNLSNIPDCSVDYIFVDPPFGSNYIYSELNMIHESWLKVKTDSSVEAVVHRRKKNGTSIQSYGSLMCDCFTQGYRILKPGRWMTVEFSNTKSAVWNILQNALEKAGFVVAHVAILDKKQGSFKAVNTATAVKQDLVISAYRPHTSLEKNFSVEAGTENGVWDFISSHLKQLPVFFTQEDHAAMVTERQNYMLFDRMVAFHVQRGATVPLSKAEFYLGLSQRFESRDNMYFLPEQAIEYDRKSQTVREFLQLDLLVTDEESAIQWIRQKLLKKPEKEQDLTPVFMKEAQRSWTSHERLFDLRELLQENFLCYKGTGPIPPQIVSWLKTSSIHREKIRALENVQANSDDAAAGLATDDATLLTAARDRWYIPDPNNASQLEQLREQKLLKEFDSYCQSTQRKLKQFRIEAIRAGFKKCWQEKREDSYRTIVTIAEKLPTNVLEEDTKLFRFYNQAITRLGDH